MSTQEFIQERKYLHNVSAKTLIWYGCSFKAFEKCENESDFKLRVKELRERGVSAISVNTYLRCINAYLNWKGAGFKLPKLREEQRILETLTGTQVNQILTYKPTGKCGNLRRAHTVALSILSTGLRASECLSLTKENIDFDNLVLKVSGKGGKHRLVPFSIELRKILWKYQSLSLSASNSPTFLFSTKNNTKLSIRNLERDLKLLGKRLGISGVRFSPHTLRHHFAVSWLRGGGDIYSLARVLGHGSVKVTEGYLRSLGIEDIRATYNRISILNQMKLSI